MATTRDLILAALALADEAACVVDDAELADWQTRIDALATDIADKALARRHVEAALRVKAAHLHDTAGDLVARARRLEAEADRVNDGTLSLMEAHVAAGGGERVETPDGSWVALRVRKSQAVEVEVEALPEAWFRLKREPDKAAIGAALKGGQSVPGARLVEHESRGIAWGR